MTADGSFMLCRVNGLHGHCRQDLDVQELWNEVAPLLASREPVYALNSWRRVFQFRLATGDSVYVKDIDETGHEKRGLLNRFLSTEATRYYRMHLCMEQLGVTIPELLCVLGCRQRSGSWARSVTITRELSGYCCLIDAFERGVARDDFLEVKSRILTELATLAGKLHGLGYYFSLDNRNIFVRERFSLDCDNVALIDLDHVRRALGGRMLSRRVRRDFKRFHGSVLRLEGVSAADLDVFTSTYAAESARH